MKTLDEVECIHCGAPYGYHRASDNLCPGKRADGSVWRGQWEGSETHFKMSDEDRARHMLAKMIATSEMTKLTVALQPEKFPITTEEAAKLRAEILRVYPNLAWAFTNGEKSDDA